MKKLLLFFSVSVSLLLSAQVTKPIFFEDCESLTVPALPAGWITIDGNNDDIVFESSSYTHGSYFYHPYSGSKYLAVGAYKEIPTDTTPFIQVGADIMNDWIFTDTFTLTDKKHTLSFFTAGGSSYADYRMSAYLVTSTTIGSIVMTLIDSVKVGQGYINLEAVFNPPVAGKYRIAFHAELNGYAYPLCLDDINFYEGVPVAAMTEYYPDTTEIIDVITAVSATFDRNIEAENLSLITLTPAADVTPSISGNKLILTPTDQFNYNTKYTVNIPAGAILYFAGSSWNFTTTDSVVTMVSSSPMDFEEGFFTKSDFNILFSQAIKTLDSTKITLKDDAGTTVKITQAYTSGRYLHIKHDALNYKSTYHIKIAKEAIPRLKQDINLEFVTCTNDSLPDGNKLYGPLPQVIMVRGVSDNGRFLVGKSGNWPFMYHVMENKGYMLYPDGGEAFSVSNEGEVATRCFIGGLSSGVVQCQMFHEGSSKWLSVAGGEQTDAVYITPDGKYAGGTFLLPSFGSKAAGWRKTILGNWTEETYLTPTGATQGRISALSHDGTKAVGRLHFVSGKYSKVTLVAAYWPKRDSIVMFDKYIPDTIASEITCISGNGKYAGIRMINNEPLYCNLETGECTTIEDAYGSISSITNDGTAILTSGMVSMAFSTQVYKPGMGVKSFRDFFTQTLVPQFNISEELKQEVLDISGNIGAMSVSSDGRNWGLIVDANSAYVLHLNSAGTDVKKYTPAIEMSIFPNPATDFIIVKSDKANGLRIVDIMGKTVKTESFKSQTTVNVTSLKTGVYFVQYLLGNNVVGVEKIVIE